MKTHSLAKALRTFADILEAAPNTDISKFDLSSKKVKHVKTAEVTVNLRTLFSLSKISKKGWTELINDCDFPIDVDTKDSSRNIIGKLLNHLDANPEAVAMLKNRLDKSDEKPSSLLQALDVLLEGV